MKIYCQKCGQPTGYTPASEKPKFCSHCGTGFGKATYTLDASVKATSAKPVVDEMIHDFENLSRLEVDIDVSKPHSVKMSDLAGTSTGEVQDEERLPHPEMSREEFLENFKKEAGSIREGKKKNG